ncbi:MAG: hypothetical protein HN712_13890 [Gemmatimonadetes bacterium]|jgi:hypothetical protein|nr:hypothetical protein [Gemmatimonadota bacterium]MBT6148884.1 hypothetical protein [Gemmatimonadota bacterium]MBT7861409.1 hypothetical protein [Gemmatimonadota bacterium]
MSIPRFLLATILSALVMLALWWLWHMSFMATLYAEHTALPRDVPLTRITVLGYFLLALLMAYIYPKGYTGADPLAEGLRFGALMGVLSTLPRSLILYGIEGGHTGTLVIVDASWHIIEQGIGGLVIALLYGRYSWLRD